MENRSEVISKETILRPKRANMESTIHENMSYDAVSSQFSKTFHVGKWI